MSVHFLVNDDLCEIPFLTEVFKCCSTDIIDQYTIYVCGPEHIQTPPQQGSDVVVIILSDESDCVVPYVGNVCCVFKPGTSEKHQSNKLIPFPWGYTKYFTPQPVIKDVLYRSIDVFFSGQVITQDRYNLVQELLLIKKDRPQYNIVVNPSKGFLQGLPGDEYTNNMYDSKICICPAGTNIPESFRYYESFCAGCATVTRNYLYQTDLYNAAPYVRLESWKQLRPAIEYFLSDPELMRSYTQKTHTYYQEHYSPRACAELIQTSIRANA